MLMYQVFTVAVLNYKAKLYVNFTKTIPKIPVTLSP